MKEAFSPHYISADWILPITGPVIECGFVKVEAGKITQMGKRISLPESVQNSLPKPPAGSILTPGLINTHIHLEQTFPAPLLKAPEQPFTDWLLTVVEQLKQSPNTKPQRCQSGITELLSTGTTCIHDIASDGTSLQALQASGMRGIVSLEFFQPSPEPVKNHPVVSLFQSLQPTIKGNSRLKLGLSPHSPYNVSPLTWQQVVAECGFPFVHTHVAEFKDELAYLQGKPSAIPTMHQAILGKSFTPATRSTSPLAYLQHFNLLNPPMTLAHVIHTQPQDRQLVQERGLGLAHCPRSNMALHGQTLCWEDWAGTRIGLGTDGRLSTENLDLRAEARYAASLHGWSAQQALEIATLGGARVMDLSSKLGAIIPGMIADLVLWQSQSPVQNPYEACLSPTTQVNTVWINGETVWESPSA